MKDTSSIIFEDETMFGYIFRKFRNVTSELTAPMLASRSGAIHFIGLLANPGLPGDQLMLLLVFVAFRLPLAEW